MTISTDHDTTITMTTPGHEPLTMGLDAFHEAADRLTGTRDLDGLRRTLITGGDPYEPVEVPEPTAFVRYIDPVTKEPVEWNPDDADEEEDEPLAIEVEYLPAPSVEEIAKDLIAELPEFRHLADVTIEYRWRAKGGKVGGQARLTQCQKLTGFARDTIGAHYLIWVAADYLRAREHVAWELEALVYHELCHAGYVRLRPHEFEGFTGEVTRYGLWRHELQRAHRAFQQMQMPGLDGTR